MYETEVWFVPVAFALIKQDNLLEIHANINKTHVCSQCWGVTFMGVTQWCGE